MVGLVGIEPIFASADVTVYDESGTELGTTDSALKPVRKGSTSRPAGIGERRWCDGREV